MIEIWKDIKDYEGKYQISNLGNIKSLPRQMGFYSNSNIKIINGYIKKEGYFQVDLYKDNHRKKFYTHRLVAKAFIYNPNNYPQINHKDENKSNNTVDNLEWCTAKYNINYGSRTENAKKNKINHSKLSKKILQYDINNNFIKEFPSSMEIQRELGLFSTSIIRNCKRKTKTVGGFIWKYKDILEG